MLEKTIREKYSMVVSYLQNHYSFDLGSVIPRSEIYEQYEIDRKLLNMPVVSVQKMGFIVHFCFSRKSGARTQRRNENGERIDCYFLKKKS
jgi:hypothetical protein